jgi:hypothetical protein
VRLYKISMVYSIFAVVEIFLHVRDDMILMTVVLNGSDELCGVLQVFLY